MGYFWVGGFRIFSHRVTMASSRLLLASLVVLCVVASYGVHAETWQVSDSLPSLYNTYASYCDPSFISNWTCGFCQHNKGAQFVGFLNDHITSVFGYVIILNNEGTKARNRRKLSGQILSARPLSSFAASSSLTHCSAISLHFDVFPTFSRQSTSSSEGTFPVRKVRRDRNGRPPAFYDAALLL